MSDNRALAQAIYDALSREPSVSMQAIERALDAVLIKDDGVISVRVKRELFRFDSKQDWVNRGYNRFACCDVDRDYRIAVDAQGHKMHKGLCFSNAEDKRLFPVIVYELATNWGG